jgi:DNA repair exonuclease SbcCD ATPase subunit
MKILLFAFLILATLSGCSKDPVGSYYSSDAEFLSEVHDVLEAVDSQVSAQESIAELQGLMPRAAELRLSFDALLEAGTFEPSEYRQEQLAERVEAFSQVLEQADRLRAKLELWVLVEKPLANLMAALGIVDWGSAK